MEALKSTPEAHAPTENGQNEGKGRRQTRPKLTLQRHNRTRRVSIVIPEHVDPFPPSTKPLPVTVTGDVSTGLTIRQGHHPDGLHATLCRSRTNASNYTVAPSRYVRFGLKAAVGAIDAWDVFQNALQEAGDKTPRWYPADVSEIQVPDGDVDTAALFIADPLGTGEPWRLERRHNGGTPTIDTSDPVENGASAPAAVAGQPDQSDLSLAEKSPEALKREIDERLTRIERMREQTDPSMQIDVVLRDTQNGQEVRIDGGRTLRIPITREI